MVQTFSLCERYSKKKQGPTFQKQFSDFMETSNKLIFSFNCRISFIPDDDLCISRNVK